MKALLVVLFFVFFFVVVVIHPGQPYNTETVCFHDGEVVFYAQGYSPNSDTRPLIHLHDNTYKIRETGKRLVAECKSSWSSYVPKGREYWTLNKPNKGVL